MSHSITAFKPSANVRAYNQLNCIPLKSPPTRNATKYKSVMSTSDPIAHILLFCPVQCPPRATNRWWLIGSVNPVGLMVRWQVPFAVIVGGIIANEWFELCSFPECRLLVIVREIPMGNFARSRDLNRCLFCVPSGFFYVLRWLLLISHWIRLKQWTTDIVAVKFAAKGSRCSRGLQLNREDCVQIVPNRFVPCFLVLNRLWMKSLVIPSCLLNL